MKQLAEFIRSLTRPILVVSWLYMTFGIIWYDKAVADTLLVGWIGLGVTMIGWWYYDRSKNHKPTP